MCHGSTVCVLTSCASAAVWVESFLSSSDIMWMEENVPTCDFHAQQDGKMYASANISISSIATGMWAYGISFFQNSTQWIEKKPTFAFGCCSHRGRRRPAKKEMHIQEKLCISETLLLHLHLFVFLSVTTSANLSMNSQRGRARGGGGARRLPPDQMAAGAPPVTAPAH